jgi:hypothetical protein
MRLTWHADIAEAKADKALNGLEQLANEIKSLSQERCPVDTGTLRGSAQLAREKSIIRVGYGGAASAYSIEQHENLNLHHPVGQAKFLESAFDELKGRAKQFIKAAMS